MRTSSTKLIHKVALAVWIICLSVIFCVSVQKTRGRNVSSKPLTLVAKSRVFTESRSGSARIRTDQTGNIYVLNREDSSILVYDRTFKFLRRIGSFGQGPEDLMHPSDFTIDRNGRIIVADTGNNRIQILSAEGKRILSFKYYEPSSIDVLSTGEIWVVGKADEHLIRVYSKDGKFLRNVGELAPTGVEATFPRLHYFLNRGSLWVDRQDNIYWTGNYLLTPTIRKYSPEGKLSLEIRLSGSTMERLVARAQERLKQSLDQKMSRASGILNGVVVNELNGDIWVFPAAPEFQIYDSKGNLKHEFLLKVGDLPIGGWDALILDSNQVVVVNLALGCYLFQLPAESKNP